MGQRRASKAAAVINSNVGSHRQMKTRDIFDEIVKGVSPFLKDNGFKKKHHTFLKSGDKDYVINFQLSKFNDGLHTDFFINFGLHDQVIFQTEIKNTWDCLIANRIISVKKEKDEMIVLDENDDVKNLTTKINKAFQEQVIDFYNWHQTTEQIIEYLINETGLARYQEVYTYLFKTNQIDKVELFTRNIINLLGPDPRIEKIANRVGDIGQSFGHDFDFKKIVAV